jgi:hypothetical protein
MRHLMVILALLALAAPSNADTAKRDLIRELLKVIDGKALTQSLLDAMLDRDEPALPEDALNEVPAEQRREYEAIVKKRAEEKQRFRDQMFARIDYATYTEEVLAPVFDRTFTSAELKDLVVFFKTTAGHKVASVFPELARSMMKNTGGLEELAVRIRDEMTNGDPISEPWKRTMTDLRAVATATEAYATDANKYPIVNSYSDLAGVLSPTYIKSLPEKDAWGTPFLFAVSGDGEHYRFVSAGADKRFEWNAQHIEMLPENFEGRAVDNFDADIIFQDGRFVQFPAVAKKELQ